WLYRGDADRFVRLIAEHLASSITEGSRSVGSTHAFMKSLAEVRPNTADLSKLVKDEALKSALAELDSTTTALGNDVEKYVDLVEDIDRAWSKEKRGLAMLKAFVQRTERSAEASHDLVRDIDQITKLVSRINSLADKEPGAKESGIWSPREVRA